MPASYVTASIAEAQMVSELILNHHSDMDSASVKVDLLFAFRDPEDEKGTPALAKDGHRVLGKSSILGLKDRVKGMGDCEIILDGDAWANLDKDHRAALIDHQLEHFEVRRDKNGDFVWDDIQRPVLKLRPHDRVIRLFDNVAVRHGAASIEVDQLRTMFLKTEQAYLPFVPKK